MPDLELKPDDYKFRGKDGRWHRRDDKRFLFGGLVACLAVLGFIFFKRNEITDSAVLFGGTAMFAAAAGIFLGNLLKDVY